MTVRRRRPDDLPALVEALCAVHERDGYRLLWCFTRLFVALGLRGAGAGAAVLEVSPADGPAVALYRRQGWREAGDGPAGWVPGGGTSLLLVAPA